MQSQTLLLDRIPSPVGTLQIAACNGKLCALEFENSDSAVPVSLEKRFGSASVADDPFGFCTKIKSYFDGELTAIDNIEVALFGTEFQNSVWLALRSVPAGQTMSYGELAKRLGNDNASRAVGITNGRNPVAIVLPCHRIIGSNGKLTGYGGGLPRKQWLLEHERKYAKQQTERQLSLLC